MRDAPVLPVPDLLKRYIQPAVAAFALGVEADLLRLYAGFQVNETDDWPLDEDPAQQD